MICTGAALAAGLNGGAIAASDKPKPAATGSFWEPLDRQMVDWLEPREAARVLDAGCGVGYHTPLFAEKATAGAVAALDINPKALEACRERVRGAKLAGRVTFHEGDVMKPPFEKATFDLVWTSHVLHILKDPVAGAKALKATLKPGGRLAVREDRSMTKLLPDDLGIGTPGLEYRVEAAFLAWFFEDRLKRGRVPYGWSQVLKEAGFREVTTRSFLFELSPPFTPSQKQYLRQRLRGHLRWRDKLTAEDVRTLEKISDPGSEHDALKRPDLHLTSVSTVYVGVA